MMFPIPPINLINKEDPEAHNMQWLRNLQKSNDLEEAFEIT